MRKETTIYIKETKQTYPMRYTESEMAEVFTAAEREAMDRGGVIEKNGCKMVNCDALARKAFAGR